MSDGPDYQLRNAVDRLSQQVSSVQSDVSLVGNRVHLVGQETSMTRSELATLRQDFERFVRQNELTSNIQRAEVKIGNLEAQAEHEFGHYKVVRRSAIGILQEFDSGLVSQETVRTVGEQLMLQTPRYWLAPVLVALSAWASDDQTLCSRAVEVAYTRSPAKTSLFMSLVLRRQGRQVASVRWLRHYLNNLDPMALGRDFAVVLEAISQGAFGAAGREAVGETLDGWRALFASDEQAIAQQVKRWHAECEEHAGRVKDDDYARLAAISPQWPLLRDSLAAAMAQGALLEKYSSMMNEEIAPSATLEDAVDDILDQLVREYDSEELPIRRELAYNLGVVRHDGDLVRAQATADAEGASFETTIDYLTVQSTSALSPALIGVSRSTQRVAVASCHDWFERGHEEFTMAYRGALPSDVVATFTANHTVGAKAFQLPTWSGSFRMPMDQLEGSLRAHWDASAKSFIDGFAYDWRRNAIVPAIVTVLVLLILGNMNLGLGFVAALLVGGIWGFVIYNRYQTALKQQAEAKALIESAKQDSVAQMRGAHAELTDWTSAYGAADSSAPKVRELIQSTATAQHGSRPFEGRTLS
jgi:hypothetical protein